jgi:hypothetical protein
VVVVWGKGEEMEKLILLLFLFFLPSSAFPEMKSQADLDNFRGIKWGTHIPKLSKDFVYRGHYKETNSDYYTKKEEGLDVLGIDADEIQYVFFEKKFVQDIMFFKSEHATKLIDLMADYLGKDGKVIKDEDSGKVIWGGKNAGARFTIYKSTKKGCDLMIMGVKEIAGWQDKLEANKKARMKKGL